MIQPIDFVHGPRRDRTCDPLIKSLSEGFDAPRPHPLTPRFLSTTPRPA
jgi:hypothetical protein